VAEPSQFRRCRNGAGRLGRPGSSRAPTSHGHRIRSAGDSADLRGVCGATPVGHSGKVCPGGFLRTFNPERFVMMGHVLHDWDLDQKKRLIRKAFDALPADGSLIVYESIIDNERRQNTFGLLTSLNML